MRLEQEERVYYYQSGVGEYTQISVGCASLSKQFLGARSVRGLGCQTGLQPKVQKKGTDDLPASSYMHRGFWPWV